MKELAYILSAFANLAGWVKGVMFTLLATTLIGAAAFFGQKIAIIVAVGLLITALLFFLYMLLVAWVRNRKAAELRGGIGSSAANRGITDPAARARLDDMRRSFTKGLDKFEASGKDFYGLPWYVICGEPGSGKTEAIRHSQVGFPPGMQDDFQGVGGTINMNWWFTNYAVILDTAGRLIFEEVEPGVTSEWKEFLGLLNKHRRNCPINGLLLAIPVDSLIRNTQEEMERKAGKIARQLDLIQRELGVRFPVFVLVTKCDLINGFRSFFDNLDDPKVQQQMLGWSNPAPLDAPFRPELVEDHLRTVAQRIRRRRLGLLIDPAPATTGGRRLDEVDSLFDLPQSLHALAPRLRRYLETIFVAGEWSSRPLFLRGIYFTSSMREGSELDEALAQALGRPVADLPGGKAWERERSFFLRDLFLDKVFREDGLVTRAKNAGRVLLVRKLILFGTGVAALLGLLAAGLLGYNALLESGSRQEGIWARASENLPPILEAGPVPGTFQYTGDQPVGPGLSEYTQTVFTRPELSRAKFQVGLQESAAEKLNIPWIFRPFRALGTDPDKDRHHAQRVLFESRVLKPVLDSARVRMTAELSPLDQNDRARAIEARALAALVHLEVEIVGRTLNKTSPKPGQLIAPLLEYTTGTPGESRLADVMTWTYTENPNGRPLWAPDWASGGNSLAANHAIRAGLERLIADAQASMSGRAENFKKLTALADTVRKYLAVETDLGTKAAIKDDPATSERAVSNAFDQLQETKARLDQNLAQIRQAGLFEAGPETLTAALNNVTAQNDSRFGQIKVMLADIDRVLPPPPEPGKESVLGNDPTKDPKFTLLREIRQRLADISGQIAAQLKGVIDDKTVADFKALDENSLASSAGSEPDYLKRWNAYRECAASVPDLHYKGGQILIGGGWKPLESLRNALDDLSARIDKYPGKMKDQFSATCNYFLTHGQSAQQAEFLDNYIRQARAALRNAIRFPLVWPPGPENQALDSGRLRNAKGLLAAIRKDLQTDTFAKMKPESRQTVSDFARGLAPLYTLADILMKPDGTTARVSVTLLNGQAQRQLSGPDLAPMPTPPPPLPPKKRGFWGRLFGGEEPTPVPQAIPTFNPRNWNAVELLAAGQSTGVIRLDSDSDTPLGKFPMQQPLNFRLYHTPSGEGAPETVSGGANWSALRLLARLGGKPVGAGDVWRVSLKPGEPTAVWLQFQFENPLPPFESWPTIDSVGLRDVALP